MKSIKQDGQCIGFVTKQPHSYRAVNIHGNERCFRLLRNAKAWLQQSASEGGMKHIEKLRGVQPFTNPELRKAFLGLPPDESVIHSILEDRLNRLAAKLDCPITRQPFDSFVTFETIHGAFNFATREIYLHPTLTKGEYVHALAHELAHQFSQRIRALPPVSYNETEQFIEAVAYAVCADYGVDYSKTCVNYIKNYDTPLDNEVMCQVLSVKRFFSSSELQGAYLRVYNEFKYELDRAHQVDE